MGDAQASNPIANWRVVNRFSDLPRSQLSCNAAEPQLSEAQILTIRFPTQNSNYFS